MYDPRRIVKLKRHKGPNPFIGIRWTFLEETETQDFVSPGLVQLEQDDEYQLHAGSYHGYTSHNTDQAHLDHQFETWKDQYMTSLQIPFESFEPNSNRSNSIAPTNKQHDEILRQATFNPDSPRMKQLEQTENDIMKQTQQYIDSLNELSQTLEPQSVLHRAIPESVNTKTKHATFFNKTSPIIQNNGHLSVYDEYKQKHDVLSKIPSTEQLLNDMRNFEKQLENEMIPIENQNTHNKLEQTDHDDQTTPGNSRGRSRQKIEPKNDNDWNDSRSPSPVIIWRPSSRVKLATDIPPQLK